MNDELPYTMRQLKALVANGADLSLHELRVMLSLIVFADSNGQSYPSNDTIGKPWGMTDSNVRAAVRKLKTSTDTRPPLIETEGHGGKGVTATRRLLLSPADTRSDSDRLESNPVGIKPARKPLNTRSDSDRKPGQNLTPEETIEDTNEEKENTRQSSSVDDTPLNGHDAALADFERTIETKSRAEGRELADAIYAAYPRKVAPAAAKDSIVKAIAKLAKRAPLAPGGVKWGEWLLARTTAFGEARARAIAAGDSVKFTPHPATWFNRGSYEDDPTEWEFKPHTGAAHERRAARAAEREFQQHIEIPVTYAGRGGAGSAAGGKAGGGYE